MAKKIAENAGEALRIMQADDPVALKNAYGRIFEKIIVGDVDQNGVRGVEFVMKDGVSESVAEEDVSGVSCGLGRPTGIA